MDRNNEFSVYPNQTIKHVLHVLYWVLMFLFIVVITSYSFRTAVFNEDNVLFSGSVLLNTIIIHYFICHFAFRHIRKKRWVMVLVDILLVYVLSVIITTGSLTFLKYSRHQNVVIDRLYERYAVTHWENIFSGALLIWILSFIIWFNTLGIVIKIVKDFHESSLEKLAIAHEKNSMEINFLRAQIQPHFFFNSLNSIYGLVLENEEATKVIIQLSNLLRFSLYDSEKGSITLKEEIDFLISYLLLEKMRHKESRVQIEYNFNEIENTEKTIKPLILINFIENAFKHGINANINNTWVRIAITEKEGILTFRAANNKPAASPNKKSSEKPSGLGLKNVRRRLELEYHTRYSLDIKETEEVYEVALIIKL